MTINPDQPINFSPLHRLQWEEAQQKYVILYPEGMVELNQSSAEILKCCDGIRKLDQIVSDLEQKFATTGLTNDITAFLRGRIKKWLDPTITNITPPRWLLAELTYACPLQCPYCSNPIDYAKYPVRIEHRRLEAGAEPKPAKWARCNWVFPAANR